jgi:hypothetical protein
VFEVGEPSSTSVVPNSGNKLDSQDFEGDVAFAPSNVAPKLLSELVSSLRGVPTYGRGR